ncbi:hypothetical protein TWF106_009895 [Orbilia oligospora]|uniref:Uncharacterized protein n=1 Tax=Orbilia oligospora TaxID=2813651 RepID=A0A7C8KLF1_ORBOL|nr:hypothetical protein TWF788_000853 [Orbilia oligospora]KAF3227381.1 hypothetical protein TWF106_009895 [Orbilia oligospora]
MTERGANGSHNHCQVPRIDTPVEIKLYRTSKTRPPASQSEGMLGFEALSRANGRLEGAGDDLTFLLLPEQVQGSIWSQLTGRYECFVSLQLLDLQAIRYQVLGLRPELDEEKETN